MDCTNNTRKYPQPPTGAEGDKDNNKWTETDKDEVMDTCLKSPPQGLRLELKQGCDKTTHDHFYEPTGRRNYPDWSRVRIMTEIRDSRGMR